MKEHVCVLCFASLINSGLNLSCFQALSLLLFRLSHFLAHRQTGLGHSSLNYFSFSKQLSQRTLCSFLLSNCFFFFFSPHTARMLLNSSHFLLAWMQIATLCFIGYRSYISLKYLKITEEVPTSLSLVSWSLLQCCLFLNTFYANLWPFFKTTCSLEQLRLWANFCLL